MSNSCTQTLNNIWNKEAKLADVTSAFKKEDNSLLKSYMPVSVLPVVPKIYERIIQKQTLEYIDKHLSLHLCGYRKDAVREQLSYPSLKNENYS